MHCVEELWLAYVPPPHNVQLVGQGGFDTFENRPTLHETHKFDSATRYCPGAHATVGVGDGASEGSGDGSGVGAGVGCSVG